MCQLTRLRLASNVTSSSLRHEISTFSLPPPAAPPLLSSYSPCPRPVLCRGSVLPSLLFPSVVTFHYRWPRHSRAPGPPPPPSCSESTPAMHLQLAHTSDHVCQEHVPHSSAHSTLARGQGTYMNVKVITQSHKRSARSLLVYNLTHRVEGVQHVGHVVGVLGEAAVEVVLALHVERPHLYAVHQFKLS